MLLAGLFFGITMFAGSNPPVLAVFSRVYDFFRGESSLALLALKALITMVLLYVCSFILSNRLEVR